MITGLNVTSIYVLDKDERSTSTSTSSGSKRATTSARVTTDG